MAEKYEQQATNASWTLSPEVQKKFVNLGTFIETGTFMGGGVVQALEVGFERVHTIEISDAYYAKAAARFQDDARATCWHGDSALTLPHVLNKVAAPSLIFLDGHGNNDGPNPLTAELQAIIASPYSHTIIVDDIDILPKGIAWAKHVDLAAVRAEVDRLIQGRGYLQQVLDSKARKRSQWLLTPPPATFDR